MLNMGNKQEIEKFLKSSLCIEYEHFYIEITPKKVISGLDIEVVKKDMNKINLVISAGKKLINIIQGQEWKHQS